MISKLAIAYYINYVAHGNKMTTKDLQVCVVKYVPGQAQNNRIYLVLNKNEQIYRDWHLRQLGK